MIKFHICLIAMFAGIMIANAQSLKEISGDIVPFISVFDGTQLKSKTSISLKDGEKVVTDQGAEWKLSVQKQAVLAEPDATDYELTWTLEKGSAKSIGVGVDFTFLDWTVDNYVFVPAIVYDGNRFSVKDVAYPPYWYDKKEWRKDMPTTTTVQPTLGLAGSGGSKIELTTGNA